MLEDVDASSSAHCIVLKARSRAGHIPLFDSCAPIGHCKEWQGKKDVLVHRRCDVDLDCIEIV